MDDGNFVYTITDNRITRLGVKTGLTDNGRIEVTAGLSEKTLVVATTKGVPPPRTAVQPQMVREDPSITVWETGAKSLSIYVVTVWCVGRAPVPSLFRFSGSCEELVGSPNGRANLICHKQQAELP